MVEYESFARNTSSVAECSPDVAVWYLTEHVCETINVKQAVECL